MQSGKQFYANDAAERIVRGHQKHAPFARAHIDEGKFLKINFQARHHLLEKRGLGGLVAGVKLSQQTLAPAHGGAGGVDAMVPVIFRIAIALAALRGHGLPQKFSDAAAETPGSRPESIARPVVFPAPMDGGEEVRSLRQGQWLQVAALSSFGVRRHRQARPGVHQAESFAHHGQYVARVSPPVIRVEWIFVRAVNQGPGLVSHELLPQRPDSPRVLWRSDQDDRGLAASPHFASQFLQLLLGIHYRPGKNMDRAFRNARVYQDLAVVVFFAHIANTQLGQVADRAVGTAAPDFGGVALGEDFAGFDCALRHASAQDENYVRAGKRIFTVEPPAGSAKYVQRHNQD